VALSPVSRQAIGAAAAAPRAAQQAAGQDWQPFVLVTGLLLIGLVADRDGLFEAGGQQLAGLARSGVALYCSAAVLIGVVTALLNLDTSVAFLTPVLVYAARSRGGGEAPLLYGCLLLSNAGSLRSSRLGAVAVPLAMTAALAGLMLTGGAG
jgi:arsenical pump membrane protein